MLLSKQKEAGKVLLVENDVRLNLTESEEENMAFMAKMKSVHTDENDDSDSEVHSNLSPWSVVQSGKGKSSTKRPLGLLAKEI